MFKRTSGFGRVRGLPADDKTRRKGTGENPMAKEPSAAEGMIGEELKLAKEKLSSV